MDDPAKIAVIHDYARPTSSIEIQRYIGLAGYYQYFGKGFYSIANPLTKFTQMKVVFYWSDACDVSIQKLKELLISAPIMILPKKGMGFIILCDDFGVVLGIVLMQQGEVIAYAYLRLMTHEKNHPIMNQSCQLKVEATLLVCGLLYDLLYYHRFKYFFTQ